jgi:hypothetical protein
VYGEGDEKGKGRRKWGGKVREMGMEGKGKGKVSVKVRRRERGREGEGCGSGLVEGTGKGKGRDREEKGKGKGKEKEREREGDYFNFCSIGSFRNGFEIPKQPKQTERGDYILSEKYRNCQCFSLFRFEPKEKKSVSQDTLVARLDLSRLTTVSPNTLPLCLSVSISACVSVCLSVSISLLLLTQLRHS